MYGKLASASTSKPLAPWAATVTGLLFILTATPGSVPVAIGAASEYIVEVLVFENEVSSDGGERWRNGGGMPLLQNAVDPANNRVHITELGVDQLELASAANILARSGRYRILVHKAWKQPGFSRENAKPVRIQTPSGLLNGTIRLEVGHYLHLYMDLAFDPRSGFGGNENLFRLDQQRRVRLKEIHYFDHPRFGVLTVVRS